MIQAVCWTLVHSLWQGLLFALIAGMVMLLTRKAGAAVRYNIVCILFFLFLAVCGGTFLYEWTGTSPEEGTFAATANSGSRIAVWIDVLGRYCSEHAVLIVWGWLFIFTIKSLHMLGSFLYTQRVRHYGISPAPGDWQESVDRLCRQMGIQRAVRLVESQVVKVPLVIGHLRPMILMPLGLITGLPEGEIEAVLLHELAHIRRNDYIVNFIQNVAVNLFFFNPGLLWMSSLLRDERENCCDDMAIARTHDRAGFIRALISFKEHDLRLTGVANAFPGKKNQLMKRAMRIAQSTNKTLDPVEKIFLGVSFILISLLMAATSGSSSSTPVKMAQIPGGKYRFFVDTPSRNIQTSELRPEQQQPESEHEEARVSLASEDLENKVRAEKAMIDALTAQKNEQVPPTDEQIPADQAQGSLDNEQNQKDDERVLMERKMAMDADEQAARDKRQAEMDKIQAEHDAQQALRDREQQRLDDIQAVRDKEQAIRDKKQAERDMQQALLDKKQAERDAKQKKQISP
ncbi:MAG TPA: M56 family metallopeptidase [Puia sp.]|nr:M56 family metallopeptidase [Puia sp.]